MSNHAKDAIRATHQAGRLRASASESDPIRSEFNRALAADLEDKALALMEPPQPLERGAGHEVIPTRSMNMVGLESALKAPDMLDLEVSIQRTELADRAGVFEMAIEAASSVKAKNSVEQMLSHQMAAAHKHALRLLAEAEREKGHDWATKKATTAARLMDAFAKAALTLQRLQTGASQVVQVQHVQVNGGQAVIGNLAGLR